MKVVMAIFDCVVVAFVPVRTFCVQRVNRFHKRRKLISHGGTCPENMAVITNVPDNFQEILTAGNQFDGCTVLTLIQFQKITCAIAGTRRCRRINHVCLFWQQKHYNMDQNYCQQKGRSEIKTPRTASPKCSTRAISTRSPHKLIPYCLNGMEVFMQEMEYSTSSC